MRARPLVLVVDDDPGMLSSLVWLLGANGYDTRQAASGESAVAAVSVEEMDLVLLDLLLPDRSGTEVLAAIKQARPETPVIMVTGVSDVSAVVATLSAGAFDYITKPYQVEELLKRVSNALCQKCLEDDYLAVSSRLERSQSNYQDLVQDSPDMIYTLDADGRFTFVSGAAEEVLGYKPADLVGLHYSTIVHPGDRPVAESRFNDRRSERGSGSVSELRLMRNPSTARTSPGGEVVYAEVKAKVLYGDLVKGPAGEFQGTHGVARDHTRRKLAEQELRRQQAFFQQLFDNSPEAIALVDADNRIRRVNGSFTSLFQYGAEECDGKDLHALIVPPELMDEAIGNSRAVLATGLLKAETVRRRKDGGNVEVSLSAFPIQLDGSRIGMYATYSDISEKRTTERTAQDTLVKLRKAMGAVIHVMVSTVEARDPYTAGHQQRVSNLARAIGRKLRLSAEMVDGIRMAGAIHDLGKIKIPAEILSNPAVITSEEFGLIKIHPKVAFDILKGVEFEWPVAEVVYQHHERMDGSGYPRGLRGDAICIEARVLTVADVVEAIASHRPYRPALGVEAALEEITRRRGTCYDPAVVDACLELFGTDGFSFRAP